METVLGVTANRQLPLGRKDEKEIGTNDAKFERDQGRNDAKWVWRDFSKLRSMFLEPTQECRHEILIVSRSFLRDSFGSYEY